MNLQEQLSCSLQETARENSQYSRNEIILKIGHFGKSIAHAKCAVWVKNFFSKNTSKINLQEQLSCSVQKTAGKNSQYSRNRSILKIDHFDKYIGHAKCAVWVKNFFLQKYAENESTRTIKLFCEKRRWKKQLIFEK